MDAEEKQRIEDALMDAQAWLDAQPEAATGAGLKGIVFFSPKGPNPSFNPTKPITTMFVSGATKSS